MFAKTTVVALLVFASVVGIAADSDAEQFSVRTLKGAWGFTADGTLGGVPAVAVGRITFDGQGGCVDSATLNIGGGPLVSLSTEPGGSCSYHVNADGTGSLTADFVAATFTATFVIVDGKQEFRFIVSDGGAIASGVAKRQP